MSQASQPMNDMLMVPVTAIMATAKSDEERRPERPSMPSQRNATTASANAMHPVIHCSRTILTSARMLAALAAVDFVRNWSISHGPKANTANSRACRGSANDFQISSASRATSACASTMRRKGTHSARMIARIANAPTTVTTATGTL